MWVRCCCINATKGIGAGVSAAPQGHGQCCPAALPLSPVPRWDQPSSQNPSCFLLLSNRWLRCELGCFDISYFGYNRSNFSIQNGCCFPKLLVIFCAHIFHGWGEVTWPLGDKQGSVSKLHFWLIIYWPLMLFLMWRSLMLPMPLQGWLPWWLSLLAVAFEPAH